MRSILRWGLAITAVVAPCVLGEACGSSPASKGSAGAGATGPTSPPPGQGNNVGQVEGGVPDSGLPSLPELTNVVATQREDSVGIDFDPVDDAMDYRVYPLPDPASVTRNADGSITIKNAIYRCAGLRQTYDLPNNTTNDLNHPDAGQVYENFNPQFSWTAQVPAAPTLGYVYVMPGTGLVPVYAIGMHPAAPEVGWRESRPKIYTTDSAVRTKLLGIGGRDDGIVFYVPSAASASTQTVYYSEKVSPVQGTSWPIYTESYFGQADVASHNKDTTPPAPAFQVLSAAAPGTQPLMAVLYLPGQNHTELAVGKERFKRAANQGPGPLWHLEWAGITGPTTLVVEALATGCPFQGFLSPQPLVSPPHQTLQTLDQIQQAAPNGEVYINGQFDLPGTSFTVLLGNGNTGGVWSASDAAAPMLQIKNSSPVPIARSFLQVAPQPHDPTAWDWYEGFSVGTTFPAVTAGKDPSNCSCVKTTTLVPCDNGGGGCGYWTSPTCDIGAYDLDINPNEPAILTYGQFLGQFWDVMDDWGQDVTGTVRFTAPTTAQVDASKFIHVTWAVNTVSTDRRYPQLIVTDQASPIEDAFANPNSNNLLIQTRYGPSMLLELQAFHGLVNGKPWAVNNQSPIHAFIDYDTWDGNDNTIPSSATAQPIPPADPPFEHAGEDRMTKYDAYISSSTVYLFMDGAPAGCTQYPSNGFTLSGAVTVTFGDVLYHEAAPDELICSQTRPYVFKHEHECSETKRHWDDLGFKDGVDAPVWDATNFPCATF